MTSDHKNMGINGFFDSKKNNRKSSLPVDLVKIKTNLLVMEILDFKESIKLIFNDFLH